jgi:hypothetical protein
MTSTSLSSALVVLVIATGCAIHKAPIRTYRLVPAAVNPVLIPPGIANAEVAQRTFNANVAAGRGQCPSTPGPITIQTRGKSIRVTVTRELLLQQPIGWLNEWTADLESQGCIAPGTSPKLAEQIAEALPLDIDQAFHLLHSNQIDITSQMRIQVVSPIVRDGVAPNGPVVDSAETSGRGNSITVNIKSSANLLGYETASYAVQTKTGGIGLSIVPLYADRHIGDETERRPEPATNYFQFPPDVAFYRVFYEAQQTEYAAIVIAARTRAELERRTKIIGTGTASCDKLNNELCVAVPKQVAINGLVPVTVNGSQTFVTWGTNVGGAIRAAGERQANLLLPKLAVYKSYHGKPVAVEFDRSSRAIFNLIVSGGEVISWK